MAQLNTDTVNKGESYMKLTIYVRATTVFVALLHTIQAYFFFPPTFVFLFAAALVGFSEVSGN
jgi:hypothetical protein